MKIPTLNFTQFTDKNGQLTGDAQLFLEQIVSLLQSNLSDEGYVIPKQNTDNLAVLNNSRSANTLIVNSETNELLFNENGTYKVVQVA